MVQCLIADSSQVEIIFIFGNMRSGGSGDFNKKINVLRSDALSQNLVDDVQVESDINNGLSEFLPDAS